MIGMLVTDRREVGGDGKVKCVSCFRWNCWHEPGSACDVDGCSCDVGSWQDAPYARLPRNLGSTLQANIVGEGLRAAARRSLPER
jgi:hypothetical protein